MSTRNPLLQNLSSQIVFEAYARLTTEQVKLVHDDPNAFNDAMEANVLKILADNTEPTPSIS